MTMTKAAIIAGCDALMIEVHPNPNQALSDGPQSLTPRGFKDLMQDVSFISNAIGRLNQPLIYTNDFRNLEKQEFASTISYIPG